MEGELISFDIICNSAIEKCLSPILVMILNRSYMAGPDDVLGFFLSFFF